MHSNTRASVGVHLCWWMQAVRVRQWPKNLLVLLPPVLAHQILNPPVLRQALLAFVAFSLCASSVYLVNDLRDRKSDLEHPRKRQRPFASNRLSARSGVFLAVLLLLLSAVLAAGLGGRFASVMFLYYSIATAYTFFLKPYQLLDVILLAVLYATRIVAGSVATSIPLSFWFLGFSAFTFFSLAVLKRFAETHEIVRDGNDAARVRGYTRNDLPFLLVLGTSTGVSAVVVMALYVSSPDAALLYRHREVLWIVCPLLLYWITRAWLLGSRGEIKDDPVAFALSDRTSLFVLAITGFTVLLSI